MIERSITTFPIAQQETSDQIEKLKYACTLHQQKKNQRHVNVVTSNCASSKYVNH